MKFLKYSLLVFGLALLGYGIIARDNKAITVGLWAAFIPILFILLQALFGLFDKEGEK